MKNIEKSKILVPTDFIPIKKNQTISRKIDEKNNSHILIMSMDKLTDISGESYEENRLYIILNGELSIGGKFIKKNSLICFNPFEIFDIRAYKESIFIEISLKDKEKKMKNIEKGKVINLATSLEYVDGAITNLDIVSKDDLKLMVMALDKGEGLKPHSAPGDALLIALEGKAKVSVGDKSFTIEKGEQIVFPKDINHNVESIEKFKMLLILSIDK